MKNGKVKEISDQEFQTEVVKSELPVLVDFWAPWCSPCRMMAPILDEIAEEFDGRLAVRKINVDHNSEAAQSIGVNGIPALVLFNKGKSVKGWVGLQPKVSLVKQLNSMV